MSNKLKKKIKCCLCDKTVPFTEDCQKLFNEDVCPECAVKVTDIVNQMIEEHNESMLELGDNGSENDESMLELGDNGSENSKED